MERWMKVPGDGGVKNKLLIEDMMVAVSGTTKLLHFVLRDNSVARHCLLLAG